MAGSAQDLDTEAIQSHKSIAPVATGHACAPTPSCHPQYLLLQITGSDVGEVNEILIGHDNSGECRPLSYCNAVPQQCLAG
jgi:hypothetical protein